MRNQAKIVRVIVVCLALAAMIALAVFFTYAPLASAQADSEESPALLVAQSGVQGGTEAVPTEVMLGDTSIDLTGLQYGDWWFELRTDAKPSTYTLSTSSDVTMGGSIQTGTYVLNANSSYKFWIRQESGANTKTTLSITRKECLEQFNARGTSKASPYSLKVGKTIQSQFGAFDKPGDFSDGINYGDGLTNGWSSQWYTFTTGEAGTYSLKLTNKTKFSTGTYDANGVGGTPVKLKLQCSGGSGELSAWSSDINLALTHDAASVNLPANTTYTIRVMDNPSAALGWASYELSVYDKNGVTGYDTDGTSDEGEALDDLSGDEDTSGDEYVFMYRLYNPNSGEHFYTGDDTEWGVLVDAGWNAEGIGWVAPSKSYVPIFRMYNPVAGEHHYTMDASERDGLISVGWNYEGIGWYSDEAQTVPMYRDYNPNQFANNHNYTASVSEHEWLVSLGWQSEGYGWYAVASGE